MTCRRPNSPGSLIPYTRDILCFDLRDSLALATIVARTIGFEEFDPLLARSGDTYNQLCYDINR